MPLCSAPGFRQRFWGMSVAFLIALLLSTSCAPHLRVLVDQYQGDLILSEEAQIERIRGQMQAALSRVEWIVQQSPNDYRAEDGADQQKNLFRAQVFAHDFLRQIVSRYAGMNPGTITKSSAGDSTDTWTIDGLTAGGAITDAPTARGSDGETLSVEQALSKLGERTKDSAFASNDSTALEGNTRKAFSQYIALCRSVLSRADKHQIISFACVFSEQLQALRLSLEALDGNGRAYVSGIRMARDACALAGDDTRTGQERKSRAKQRFDQAVTAVDGVRVKTGVELAARADLIRWIGRDAYVGKGYYFNDLSATYDGNVGKWTRKVRDTRRWGSLSSADIPNAQAVTDRFYNDLLVDSCFELEQYYSSMSGLASFIGKSLAPGNASSGTVTAPYLALMDSQRRVITSLGEYAGGLTKADLTNEAGYFSAGSGSSSPAYVGTSTIAALARVAQALGEIAHAYAPVKPTSAYLALDEVRSMASRADWGTGLGSANWREVTEVEIVGGPGAKTLFVVMRDHLGNWQIKQASSDPGPMLAAAQNTISGVGELLMAHASGGATEVKKVISKRIASSQSSGYFAKVIDDLTAREQVAKQEIAKAEKNPATADPAMLHQRNKEMQDLATCLALLDQAMTAVPSGSMPTPPPAP